MGQLLRGGSPLNVQKEHPRALNKARDATFYNDKTNDIKLIKHLVSILKQIFILLLNLYRCEQKM